MVLEETLMETGNYQKGKFVGAKPELSLEAKTTTKD